MNKEDILKVFDDMFYHVRSGNSPSFSKDVTYQVSTTGDKLNLIRNFLLDNDKKVKILSDALEQALDDMQWPNYNNYNDIDRVSLSVCPAVRDMMIAAIKATEEIHTPAEWQIIDDVDILDPDGWRYDGKNFDLPIGKSEWNQRVAQCTVSLTRKKK